MHSKPKAVLTFLIVSPLITNMLQSYAQQRGQLRETCREHGKENGSVLDKIGDNLTSAKESVVQTCKQMHPETIKSYACQIKENIVPICGYLLISVCIVAGVYQLITKMFV